MFQISIRITIFSQRQFYFSHGLLGFASFCGFDLCLLSVAYYNFELVSLNAQRIRDFKSVKRFLCGLKGKKSILPFYKKHSSSESKTSWKCQGRGKTFFAFGTNHSGGVIILFSDKPQIDVKNVLEDNKGCCIFLEVLIQDAPFPLVNLYAPTKSSEQCAFFDQVANILKNFNVDPGCHIGCDFNSHLHSNLDNLAGRIESIASVVKTQRNDGCQ